MRYLPLLSTLALASALLLSHTASAQQQPLVVGVLNQQSPTKTAERWNPILRYLTDLTGIPLQLRMGATVQETNAMMGREEFDLVFTNHNFRPEYDGKYRVLARWDDRPIYGVVAVPEDSPIRTLADLRGKRVAFPSRNAFVAHPVPMAALRSASVVVEPVYSAHQDGAIAQLRARAVDAAAVNSRLLTQYAAVNGFRYREVFTSEGYADLPMSIHPRIAIAEAEALKKAMLGMRSDPRAAEALSAGNFKGFFPAHDRDYDNVRRVYRLTSD